MLLDDLTDQDLVDLSHDWSFIGRPSQQLPSFRKHQWLVWLFQGGRGAGKTRTGAEAIKTWQLAGYSRMGAIAETFPQGEHAMIKEGESCLLKCYPPEWRVYRPDHWPTWHKTERMLRWGNGAWLRLYSDEVPGALEGPQHEKLWADETARWKNLEETINAAMLGLRLGKRPQLIVTTTPRPRAAYRKLFFENERWNVIVSIARSDENRANLSEAFVRNVIKKYEGTRYGRMMLEGELDDTIDEGAVWKDSHIERARVASVPWDQLVRVVVGVDPAVTSKSIAAGDEEDSNMTGIVAAGLLRNGKAIVLADETIRAAPEVWARAVARLRVRVKASCVVGEVNNGGDLVERVMRVEDPLIPYKSVRATHGKLMRAEPIALLYDQGRVLHAPGLDLLEEQMLSWIPGDGDSPDRVDALVWALTELSQSTAGTWGHLAAA